MTEIATNDWFVGGGGGGGTSVFSENTAIFTSVFRMSEYLGILPYTNNYRRENKQFHYVIVMFLIKKTTFTKIFDPISRRRLGKIPKKAEEKIVLH